MQGSHSYSKTHAGCSSTVLWVYLVNDMQAAWIVWSCSVTEFMRPSTLIHFLCASAAEGVDYVLLPSNSFLFFEVSRNSTNQRARPHCYWDVYFSYLMKSNLVWPNLNCWRGQSTVAECLLCMEVTPGLVKMVASSERPRDGNSRLGTWVQVAEICVFLQTHVDVSHVFSRTQPCLKYKPEKLKSENLWVWICLFFWQHERPNGVTQNWQFQPGGREGLIFCIQQKVGRGR